MLLEDPVFISAVNNSNYTRILNIFKENLVKLDNTGWINGTLDISGTNDAPDSSSGGFNEYETKTGGNLLAIAHNGNLSNGIMFPVVDSFTGKKIDKKYEE